MGKKSTNGKCSRYPAIASGVEGALLRQRLVCSRWVACSRKAEETGGGYGPLKRVTVECCPTALAVASARHRFTAAASHSTDVLRRQGGHHIRCCRVTGNAGNLPGNGGWDRWPMVLLRGVQAALETQPSSGSRSQGGSSRFPELGRISVRTSKPTNQVFDTRGSCLFLHYGVM